MIKVYFKLISSFYTHNVQLFKNCKFNGISAKQQNIYILSHNFEIFSAQKLFLFGDFLKNFNIFVGNKPGTRLCSRN